MNFENFTMTMSRPDILYVDTWVRVAVHFSVQLCVVGVGKRKD